MKKRNKIFLAIIIVIAVLSAGAYATYKLYLEPVVFEKTLEKAQTVLNDETVQSEVEKFVNDMVQSGVLEDKDLKEYIDYKAKEEEKKTQSEATEVPSTQKPTPAPVQTPQPTPKPTPKPTDKPKTLTERVKSEMTADEFSFAMSIYGKIDVSYVLANINSNREEVKEYVKSHLTSSEISKSLNIYAKYSYLLSN